MPGFKARPNVKLQKGVVGRVIKSLFRYYPRMLTIALICIVINAAISSVPALFMERLYTLLGGATVPDHVLTWEAVAPDVASIMGLLIGMYVVSLIAGAVYNQLMAIITQGYLRCMREQMFNGMQDLPIRYFDTHNHGDIMSYYTNDIDTLRQMIAQSIPQLLISGIMCVTLFVIMLTFSIYLTIIILLGICAIVLVTKLVGGGASKYFLATQRAVAKTEGFVEEMMQGQKVIKVFCHEEEAKADFDKVNGYHFEQTDKANRYANMLMPIIANIGNVMYVIVALLGAVFAVSKLQNVSLSGLGLFTPAIIVSFLQTTRQFSNNIGQVSNQINSVVMGLAGAQRIINLIDEKPETDDGYVTLVNATYVNGQLTECAERTGMWAWKHPHKADGSITYTKLEGDVRLFNVDFGYVPEKIVLHDISLYAKPGQKVGRGQDDHHQSAHPLLRYCRRQDPLRRHQYQQDQEGGPEKVSRHGPAGHQPVHGQRHGQYSLRQAGRDGRGVHRGGKTGRRGRLHHPPARGLQHDALSERLQSLAGTAPAFVHRARGSRRPARHDPRRGDQLHRYPHGGDRPARHG